MKRTAFFVSDGTGITAETLGHSLLSQFDKIELQLLTRPYINRIDKAQLLVEQINEAGKRDGVRPLVFETIVDPEISNTLKQSDGFIINIFSTFISSLETFI